MECKKTLIALKFEKEQVTNVTLMNIVSKIEEEGLDIRIKNGKLMVHRSVSPSMLALIRKHKEELIEYFAFSENFPEPYIRTSGDLVIPFDSHPRYHWWRGGQSISQTRTEFEAAKQTLNRHSLHKKRAHGNEYRK